MTIFLNKAQESEYLMGPDEKIASWKSRVGRLYEEHGGWPIADVGQLEIALAWGDIKLKRLIMLCIPSEDYIGAVDSDAAIPPFHLEWGTDDDGNDDEDTGFWVVGGNMAYEDIPGCGRLYKYYSTLKLAEDAAKLVSDANGGRMIVVANAVHGWVLSVSADDEE